MTRLPAIGNGPVVYVAKDGQQVVVPLSLVYFDGAEIKTTRPEDQYSGTLEKLLEYLAKLGEIKPGPAPAAVPVLKVTAKPAGASGNKVTVRVSANADPTKVDITVGQTDIYENVTLASLAARLDADPGLFKVRAVPPDAPAPEEGAKEVKITANKPHCTIAGADAEQVVIEARNPVSGLDKNDFLVEVLDLDNTKTPSTFTLRIRWEHTVAGVAAANLATQAAIDETLKKLAYLAEFALPETGPTNKLPRVDTVALMGGREAVPALAASSNLLSST